ncbi:DNA-directed DNA polymerase alpha catalytic subunit pol1 [Savitreella phatthalungensis]
MSVRASRAAASKDVSSKFAELRALRASGKKRIETYRPTEDSDVYDTVDEAQYRDHVRQRLDQDDFVVDDNGLGYADTGADDWHRQDDDNDADSGDDANQASVRGARSSRAHGKRSKMVEPAPEEERISRFLTKRVVTTAQSGKPSTTIEEDNDFMAGILGSVSSKDTSRRPRETRLPAPKRAASPVSISRRHKRVGSILTGDAAIVSGENPKFLAPEEAPDMGGDGHSIDDLPMEDPGSSPTPHGPLNTPLVKHEHIDDIKEEDDDEEEGFAIRRPTAFAGLRAEVNIAPARGSIGDAVRDAPTTHQTLPSTDSDRLDSSSWMDLNKTLVASSPGGPPSGAKVSLSQVTSDEKVHFYWMDYAELNGALGLVGKVKEQNTGKYISAFCRIDGLMRNLYFLPRETFRSRPDEEVGMGDVHAEVSQLMRKFGVGEFRAKSSSRKYAFELSDVPDESDYLKVLYSYKSGQLPVDCSGDTFSRVFGTNTAIFEQFVLHRRIMGPCWLEISRPDSSMAQNSTWCKTEFGVADPEQIVTIPDLAAIGLPDVPPMTLASIAIRTVLNKKDNKSEIAVISARIYQDINIEDPTPADKLPCHSLTVMRPLRTVFPHGFEQIAKKQGIVLERSEAAMLNYFMAMWQRFDPDIILGHDWESQHYTTLLARLRERKVANWHRIGRLKRTDWPRTMGRAGFFAERALACGRLMCDLSNDLGKSLIRAQAWSLTEICKLELDVTRSEMDAERAMQSWTETSQGMLDYVMHAVTDTFFQAAIAVRVQILPLSRQLTTLAGNSWAATLGGTRAQRNEFILLHEFSKNKYICPDKLWNKPKDNIPASGEDDELDPETSHNSKKKDKYKGGLVFEPERGLYDRFILVMDFNSLYPSIIQEYNICFTTVERMQGDAAQISPAKPASDAVELEEVVPELPSRDTPQGILPRIIATLVGRRRQVKQLMKNESASPIQLAQWDIRQQALKLTANSMYGCLGYTKSRFYARPLAMLTTFKGREALTSTKELADELGLRVIYGDTDSVMINTGVDNYLEAMKIGQDFKRQVNERYRLLEIDIDNVFQRMLLHAKKKYAALVLTQGEGGKLNSKMEVKGLDMKRREYCALAKEASQYCLDEILSGEHTDAVVERIHEYLRGLSVKARSGEIPKHKFIILNRLGKEPDSYPQAKTMPHVQVALKRRAKGEVVRVGDVMQYIITGSAADSTHVADRAYPAADVTRTDSKLEIDFDYYLANQILPPIERLCAPIEGTDRMRIAECLGLDSSKYRVHSIGNQAGMGSSALYDMQALEATIPDSERFASCQPLVLRCRACTKHSLYRGPTASLAMLTSAGIQCSHCSSVMPQLSVNAQLHAQVHALIAQYYQSWLECDDPGCRARSQACGVYGRRCPHQSDKGCRGQMGYSFDDKALYTQLLYFDQLFDLVKARQQAQGKALSETDLEKLRALADMNAIRFDASRQVVNGFLRRCGRRYVDLASVFAFCA